MLLRMSGLQEKERGMCRKLDSCLPLGGIWGNKIKDIFITQKRIFGTFETLKDETTKFWSPRKYILHTIILSLWLAFAVSILLSSDYNPRSLYQIISLYGDVQCCKYKWTNECTDESMNDINGSLFPLSVSLCYLWAVFTSAGSWKRSVLTQKSSCKGRPFSPHGRTEAGAWVRRAIALFLTLSKARMGPDPGVLGR